MKNLIISLICAYVFFRNIQFFNGTYIYIIIAFLVGFILYNILLLDKKKKYVFTETLRKLIKLLMAFSIAVSILGFYMTYAKAGMQGFDVEMKYEAFITGLVNFVICVITYLSIVMTHTRIERRIK